MNDLQHIPESKYGPVLCTLNAPFEPAEDKIAGRWDYDHPVINRKVGHPSIHYFPLETERCLPRIGGSCSKRDA